jgi:hypothetical protein
MKEMEKKQTDECNKIITEATNMKTALTGEIEAIKQKLPVPA